MVLTVEKVKKQNRKLPNCKASEKDSVQDYWVKNLSNLHERIAIQKNTILMRNDSLPAWIATSSRMDDAWLSCNLS